jgi:hypothetical protein
LKNQKPGAKPFAVIIILVAAAVLLTYLPTQFWVPPKPVVRHVNPAG